jgi:RNA polymerase sigma-70 factor (ECF subfamily)
MAPAPESEDLIIRRILNGETALYEVLMQRYNQRLYRVALSIVGDPDEAEDVIQDAYVQAWLHLKQFAGEARFSTWLTRIAVREACSHLERNRRYVRIGGHVSAMPDPIATAGANDLNPEARTIKHETSAMLESAIAGLPPRYRSVFVLRDIEGLSIAETAQCLDVNEENVKIRLHRARRMLRKSLRVRMGADDSAPFQFLGARCERTRMSVLHRIGVFSVTPP